ncbi:MAG TPA: DsbA family protein [Mycobacteriales bacterium]|nr:DsbA family protein [Mycobacteriales bacterium]
MTTRTPVDFWFDPACPWAWMTSRWVLEAATVRDLEVTWRLLSLYVLNEGKEPSEKARENHLRSHQQERVIAAARNAHGTDVVLPLYTALGTSYHLEKTHRDRAVVEAALLGIGLPADLADALDDEKWDVAIAADHDEGMARVGLDVGTPIVGLEDTAFFGPVVTPAPKGEDAGRLWDGVLLVARTPGFYELKRTRDARPSFD